MSDEIEAICAALAPVRGVSCSYLSLAASASIPRAAPKRLVTPPSLDRRLVSAAAAAAAADCRLARSFSSSTGAASPRGVSPICPVKPSEACKLSAMRRFARASAARDSARAASWPARAKSPRCSARRASAPAATDSLAASFASSCIARTRALASRLVASAACRLAEPTAAAAAALMLASVVALSPLRGGAAASNSSDGAPLRGLASGASSLSSPCVPAAPSDELGSSCASAVATPTLGWTKLDETFGWAAFARSARPAARLASSDLAAFASARALLTCSRRARNSSFARVSVVRRAASSCCVAAI